eukprot:scaffold5725_cov387-Prasinococcus_capsulatus_cf.AAC.3
MYNTLQRLRVCPSKRPPVVPHEVEDNAQGPYVRLLPAILSGAATRKDLGGAIRIRSYVAPTH